MQPDQIAELRGRLDEFVEGVFASLPRKVLRGKGGSNLQGLMREGRRKSMQPMGGRLGVDYQQLAQFASSSPRPAEPVRQWGRCASGVGAPVGSVRQWGRCAGSQCAGS